MLSEKLRKRVEIASVTVSLPGSSGKGRGVLVPGEMILTVAHNLQWTCEGDMVHGDPFLMDVQSSLGAFRLDTAAVEPRSDIALLRAPDRQWSGFENDIEVFENFCDETEPLNLSVREREPQTPFAVYVYTHTGIWIEGKKKILNPDANACWFEFHSTVPQGTSGSAIVDEYGEVVGVVSLGAGINPRPSLALPAWAVKLIRGNQAPE